MHTGDKNKVMFAAIGALLARTSLHAIAAEEKSGGKQVERLQTVGIHYQSLAGGSTPSQRPASLCELVKAFDGPAGIFVVEDLVGATEDTKLNGQLSAFTYVTLRLEQSWKASTPDGVIARIMGGPAATPGVTQVWSINLSVGQRVGVLLSSPADNKGYYSIHNLGLFSESGEGASNGQLYTRTKRTLAEIGVVVQQARQSLDSGKCIDVLPDYGEVAPQAPVLPDVVVNPSPMPSTVRTGRPPRARVASPNGEGSR